MAQIGTVRLETQNSGVVDVPVFEPGDSASGIYEFVRVETASGPGFIPVTDPVDATYPYLRVQSQNNGIVAVTDTPGSDIPDSVVRHYDPTAETVGETSKWSDQIESVDLSGSYEIIDSGINNLQTARFNGTDDDLTNSNISVSTLPFAAVFVSQYQGDPNNDDAYYFDPDIDLNFTFRDRNDGDYQAFVGGGTSTNPRGGTPDQDPHVWVVEAVDGGGVRAEQDGTEILSATGDNGAIDGFTVGSRTGRNFAEIDFGDFYLTENHSSSDLDTLKNNLSNKWGITLA